MGTTIMNDDKKVSACWIICETRRRHPETWFVPNPTMGKAIRQALQKRGAIATRPASCRPTNCPEKPAGERVVNAPTVGMLYRNVDARFLEGTELDGLCGEVAGLVAER